MAPACAINSCAADMARWLLAQLTGGQVDGEGVGWGRAAQSSASWYSHWGYSIPIRRAA